MKAAVSRSDPRVCCQPAGRAPVAPGLTKVLIRDCSLPPSVWIILEGGGGVALSGGCPVRELALGAQGLSCWRSSSDHCERGSSRSPTSLGQVRFRPFCRVLAVEAGGLTERRGGFPWLRWPGFPQEMWLGVSLWYISCLSFLHPCGMWVCSLLLMRTHV